MKNCLYCGKSCAKRYCKGHCQHEHKYQQYIKGWLQGNISGWTTGDKKVSSHVRRYIEERDGIQCCLCGWKEVNAKTNKIPVQLDHIDGNYLNNTSDNLRLLCPNCHSLTPTYMGLNKGNGRPRFEYRKRKARDNEKPHFIFCLACGKETKNPKYCSYRCSNVGMRKVERPTKEQLEEDILHMPMTSVGKKYGVSDNSIRKWLKFYEL